jgi:hypothetical protein
MPYLPGLVAPQRLLVPCRVHQSHGAGLIQLVQQVLAGSLVGAFIVAPDSRRPIFQVRGENNLRAIDKEKQGESRGSAGGGSEALHNRW